MSKSQEIIKKFLIFYSLDLNIERGGSVCEYDSLRVYDGAKDTDTELARYCTALRNTQLVSSRPEMRLHFKTDSSGNQKGFKLRWKFVKKQPGKGVFFQLS